MSFFPDSDNEKLQQDLTQQNVYFNATIPPSSTPSNEDNSCDRSATSPAGQDSCPVPELESSWTSEQPQTPSPQAFSSSTQSMFEQTYADPESYSTASDWIPTSTTALPTTYAEYMPPITMSATYPVTTTSWNGAAMVSFVSDYDTSPCQSEYSAGSRQSIVVSSPFSQSDGFLPAAGSPYIKVEDDMQRYRLYSIPGMPPSDQPLHVNPGDVYSSPSLSSAEQQAMDTFSFIPKVESEDFKPFLRSESPQQQDPRYAPYVESCIDSRPKRGFTTHANSICHCHQCGKLFQRTYNLKAHMETHDPHREQPHACLRPGCKRRFVRRTDLLRHEQSVHLKERNYGCHLCSSSFARKDTLRRHIEDGCPRRPELKKRVVNARASSDCSDYKPLRHDSIYSQQ